MAGAMSLGDLFPDADYRFHLTLRRGEPADFFRPYDSGGHLLAERGRWLATAPARYAALTDEGEPLLLETEGLLQEWNVGPMHAEAGGGTPSQRLQRLARQVEPDLLFLSPDADRKFRLRGGALCFPTGWALEEKIGQALESIHGVVPGLNAAIGAQIHQFLQRLKPGAALLRSNWGFAATNELNLHPARNLPPLQSPLALDRTWLRVERQALVALPRSGGVLFGIRIELHGLERVRAEPAAAAGLRRALATMPEDLAVYKRIADVRRELIALLA